MNPGNNGNRFFVLHQQFHSEIREDENGIIHVPRGHSNPAWYGQSYLVDLCGRVFEEPFLFDSEDFS